MNRRDFLQATFASFPLLTVNPVAQVVKLADKGSIITVSGSIDPQKMGVTLVHEHIMVDFIGADKADKSRYNTDEVFRTALPHLKQIKELGCNTLIECTPAYLGRDAALLKRLAEASGMQIISNTGYYGAQNGKFLPAHAFTETPQQLAARWLNEWRNGIDGSSIKPGFMKVSVDKDPLADFHRKILQAAALTHLQSGLTIAAHTGNGKAALEEIAILEKQGVHGNAFIWVHAQSEPDTDLHVQAARKGAWIEFDGISPDSVQQHVDMVKAMKEKGFLKQILVSHDAGWYHVGEAGGGNYRPYDTLFTSFLPALRQKGFTDADIKQLLTINPREAFSVKIRKK